MDNIREDAQKIIKTAIADVLPDQAVKKVLLDKTFGNGKIILIAIGKAAWTMAKAASDILGKQIYSGLIVTKYDHSQGAIDNCEIIEAGHPVPDNHSFEAGSKALEMVSQLEENDQILFLISGGGSALFESPLIPQEEIQDITDQLLACGANIIEINTIRKRLSAVKGGRFGLACQPAKVFSIVLSDVIGDRLDIIAGGPAFPDATTAKDAENIIEKYGLRLSDKARETLLTPLPENLSNVETVITGSVSALCLSAKKTCQELGYEPLILTDHLDCTARDAGTFLGDIALSHQKDKKSTAWIAGGETVVRLTGKGKGGRNQEIALSAAEKISECENTLIFSIGSDGTDGPTDAAGGWCDGNSKKKLNDSGISISEVLQNNDAYHALKECGCLIKTGPTGTNVNDLSVVLIRR